MHPLDWLFYPWTNSFKAPQQNMVFTTSSISPLIVVELDLSLMPFFSHFLVIFLVVYAMCSRYIGLVMDAMF
jgi:hypothetical protein